MLIGITTVLLFLLIYYFVQSTSSEQKIDLNLHSEYFPNKSFVATSIDLDVPIEVIWKYITDLSNYHLWFPWVYSLKVTNKDVSSYTKKHSLLEYDMKVGSYFKIQPFFGIPALNCRFLRLDDQKNLTLEMGFFPFNKEIVNFNLVPYKNCVEVNYSSRSNGLFSFITIPMFAWLGKDILNNLKNSLPNIKIEINDETSEQVLLSLSEYIKKGSEGDLQLINSIPDRALRAKVKGVLLSISTSEYVQKALDGDKNIIAGIADIKLKTKVKSAYLKAKRIGTAIPVFDNESESKESTDIVNKSPREKSAASSDELSIEEYVQKALSGDEEIINSIENRVLRAKVKAGIMKAKKNPPAKKSNEDTSKKNELSIEEYVQKALSGDEEIINSIENRVLRAKVKAGIMKAKRSK